MSMPSISGIEIWANKNLQGIDYILKELNSKLSSNMLLIINDRYCQMLKSLRIQKNLFETIKILIPDIKKGSVDIEKIYLELKKILFSLSESCNEVVGQAQKLKMEILQLQQKNNN